MRADRRWIIVAITFRRRGTSRSDCHLCMKDWGAMDGREGGTESWLLGSD